MSDEHKIWITGRKIRKVVIEAKEVKLEGDSGSTTRAFTPPNDLDDGPVTIKITLSDNTEVVRELINTAKKGPI